MCSGGSYPTVLDIPGNVGTLYGFFNPHSLTKEKYKIFCLRKAFKNQLRSTSLSGPKWSMWSRPLRRDKACVVPVQHLQPCGFQKGKRGRINRGCPQVHETGLILSGVQGGSKVSSISASLTPRISRILSSTVRSTRG